MAKARVYYVNRGEKPMIQALIGNIAQMCVDVEGIGRVHYQMTSGDAVNVKGPTQKILGVCDGSCEQEDVQEIDLPEPILELINKLLAERQ